MPHETPEQWADILAARGYRYGYDGRNGNRHGSGRFIRLLKHIAALDPDMPVLIEHLEHPEEYDAAPAYLKSRFAQVLCGSFSG